MKSKTNVQPQLEALLSLIEGVNHVGLQGIVGSLKKHIDEILVPFEQLDRIKAELLEQVHESTLEYLYMAWHHEHFSHQTKSRQKQYHQSERNFWLELAEDVLGPNFQNAKTLVFDKLDSVVRASSLIEMVNSILRPFLNQAKGQITQEFLNLIMFYHNHRLYKSGKRKGKAPIELLTGETLAAHWSDLLIQATAGPELETQHNNVISFHKPGSKLPESSEMLPAFEQSSTEPMDQAA
ncbi:MAG: hypothetical protein HQM12_05325 [SAR324 cluster bacterium]|nr:hypothetical protein [SAR324 cluster bacterium]